MQGLWNRFSGRLTTLAKFAILSAVPIFLLGLALSYLLNDFVYDRTLDNASDAASIVGALASMDALTPADLEPAAPADRWHQLESELDRTILGSDRSSLRVWNRDLRVAFASPGAKPREAPALSTFEGVFAGAPETLLLESEGAEPTLLIITPLHGVDSRTIGALEIAVPYRPLARVIKRDFRPFYLVLLIGLNVLWAALFIVAARASRDLRKRAEEQEHLALHDVLTGLANRALFRDRVKQALRLAEREHQTIAVLLMDLDRFKEINDTLGHHQGDFVLQEAARRLKNTLRHTDTIARLGGDEFAVLVPHVPDPSTVVLVADKIREALAVPFMVQGLTLDIRASIGVAFFPSHGKDVDTLIQKADVAMYLAKAAGSGCEIYAIEKDQHSLNKLAMVGELRNAIAGDEFVVHYQPKVDLRTGEVGAVEALLRWEHALRGTILPGDFIPLAEHTGLIEILTVKVIEDVLEQCAQWRDQGLDLKVSVNISARNLHDEKFPEQTSELLRKWKIPPSSLLLEITESTILADPARASGVLGTLARMGIELSIDDFGTGHSSLVYLRRLPLKELKIDKSFVMNMSVDDNDAVIVRSLIDLGRNLGLQVVAEGVETEEVWDALTQMGCDYAQGYFHSRPMAADQLTRLLRVMAQEPI